MNRSPLFLSLSLLTLLAAGGCKKSQDPLTGTWSRPECYGEDTMPADIESCNTALTFTADLEIFLDAEEVSLPATASNPGCVTTRRVFGQTWSTKHGKGVELLEVSGDGEATIERSGCVNSEDNLNPITASDISIPSGETEYEVNKDTLNILTGDLIGTYSAE